MNAAWWVSFPNATFGIECEDGLVSKKSAPYCKRWHGKPCSEALVYYRRAGAEIVKVA